MDESNNASVGVEETKPQPEVARPSRPNVFRRMADSVAKRITTAHHRRMDHQLSRAVRVITTDPACSQKQIRKSLNGIRAHVAVLSETPRDNANCVDLEYELAK